MKRTMGVMFVFMSLVVSVPNALASGLKLIKSNDDELCKYIQSVFQGDFDKYGQEKFSSHKEYNWVKWESGEYLLTGGPNPNRKRFKYAKFDINNDGKIETIFIETQMIFARETSELLVVGDDSYNVDAELEFTIEEIITIPGIKVSSRWPYKLDIESLDLDSEFYKGNNNIGLIDIYPLKLNTKIYLSLAEKNQFDNQPKWHVIVEYKDEQFPIGRGDRRSTSKLKHICYFDSISSKSER